MSKRLVTDPQEIYDLLRADPAFTEAANMDKDGAYILGANGSKRHITQLEMEDD